MTVLDVAGWAMDAAPYVETEEHGTRSGYRWHQQRREDPCPECREAEDNVAWLARGLRTAA